jgi:hypothetical protein
MKKEEVNMAAKLYRASANFPTLGDEAHQEVQVEAGNWSAAMGLAARRLKTLTVLKRKQIKLCSIVLQLVDGAAELNPIGPLQGSLTVEAPEGNPIDE